MTALSIRAAALGSCYPVFCWGLAVKFISELSAPNKSSPPGAIWQIRPGEPICSAEVELELEPSSLGPQALLGEDFLPISLGLSHSPWLFSPDSGWGPWAWRLFHLTELFDFSLQEHA